MGISWSDLVVELATGVEYRNMDLRFQTSHKCKGYLGQCLDIHDQLQEPLKLNVSIFTSIILLTGRHIVNIFYHFGRLVNPARWDRRMMMFITSRLVGFIISQMVVIVHSD